MRDLWPERTAWVMKAFMLQRGSMGKRPQAETGVNLSTRLPTQGYLGCRQDRCRACRHYFVGSCLVGSSVPVGSLLRGVGSAVPTS